MRENRMRLTAARLARVHTLCVVSTVALAWLCACLVSAGQESAPKKNPPVSTTTPTSVRSFDTSQQAADGLIDAADKFDQAALIQIFGPDGNDIVFSGEYPQDRKHATDFVAEAREKKNVSLDPKTGIRA